MNDYIIRESVNRIILEAIRYCDTQSDQTDDLTLKFSWDKCSGMLESVKGSVDNIPNADVRPSSRSTWIEYTQNAFFGFKKNGDPIHRDVKVYHCNSCGRGSAIKENFCPNCGCYMGGEANG